METLRPTRRLRRDPRGFTLVELLVVITIIGILMALLLPAVQSARESARRVQCENNVKQLSLGMLAFESSQGFFPSGGWSCAAVGDPDRGVGPFKQPGAWAFQILPYTEQQNIYMLASGLSGSARGIALGQMVQTLIATHNCPTRRPLQLSPYVPSSGPYGGVTLPSNFKAVSDYACNAGDYGDNWAMLFTPDSEQSTYPQVDSWTLPQWIATCSTGLNEGSPPFVSNPFQAFNGISFTLSRISLANVTDGASNTYMLGEKYLNPDEYFTGTSWGDDQSMYVGFDDDNYRTTYYVAGNTGDNIWYQPTQDTPGFANTTGFGSAHPGSCVMSFCDGSIHSISYGIDGETNRRLGNRSDGLPIDASKF